MRRSVVGIVVFLLAVCPVLWGQSTSALINEALDKQWPVDVKATLPQVMAAISNQTGVPIRAEQAVWDLLPWGEQTNITAKIENQTLRQSLDVITRKLGLTFAVKDETVELQPMPALRRLGRRATVQELQALDLLSSTPLQQPGQPGTVGALLAGIDAKLEAMKSPFAIENRAGSVSAKAAVQVARNATLMDALDAITTQTDSTWYPWGKSIVVVHKEDLLRNLLAKTVTIHYAGEDVGQVLMELSQKCGVDFYIEPGALQHIAPSARTVRLILENASVQQALESIAGFTGLGYVVNDRGVYIWNQAATPAAQKDRVMGLLQLDGGMQVLLPESQVPADIKEYMQHKTRKQWERMREMMKEEGFKPAATQPTTKEADERL